MRRKSLFDISNYTILYRIPFSLDSCSFDERYPPALTPFLPHSEFKGIIGPLNEAVRPRLLKAREELKWYARRIIITVFVIVIVNLLAGLLLAFAMKDKLPYLAFAIALVVFSVFVGIIAGISAKKAPPALSMTLKQVTEEINDKLDKLNLCLLPNSRVAWSLVGDFECMRSRKSFKNSVSPMTYIPIWVKKVDSAAALDAENGMGHSMIIILDDYETESPTDSPRRSTVTRIA